MYPTERRDSIISILSKKDIVKVSGLSESMGVSESSIRRDLRGLEREGIVQLFYGGAKLTDNAKAVMSRPYTERTALNAHEKILIARKAMTLIEEGECILLDAGSTTAALAYELREYHRRLTVVTTAPNIALILKSNPYISVILTGGLLRTPGESLIGELAEATLDRLHISKAFVGAAGIVMENGDTGDDMHVMYGNLLEGQVRKKILETIPDVTVLADHTKFGRKALVAVFSIAFAQCVVTNKAIPAEYLDWLTKSGVRTVIADNATKEEG